MYVARDNSNDASDLIHLFAIEPVWKADLGIWVGGDHLSFEYCLCYYSGLPKVKRGECIEVELRKIEEEH